MKAASLLSILGVALATNDTTKLWDMVPPELFGNFSDDGNLGICYGSNTNWAAYPYVVALRYPSGSACCSGSIISLNPGVILTAAHCDVCTGAVVVGCNNPANCDGTAYSVAQRSNHPSWDGNIANGADIAVWRLVTSINFPGAQTLSVPNNEVSGVSVRVTGYGQTQAGSIPTQLQTMTSNSIGQGTCNSQMSGIVGITSAMYCITNSSPGSNAQVGTMCSGDSGGPIVFGSTVYGVNSFVITGSVNGCGNNCFCCSGYPQVGANVATYSSFVNGQMSIWKEEAAKEAGVMDI